MSHEVIDQVLVGLAMVALICLPFYWNYVLGLATIVRRTGGTVTDGELDQVHRR